VELKLKRMSPGEREAAMSRDDEDGYVLVKPLSGALPNSKIRAVDEALFPDLVRAIDMELRPKRLVAGEICAGRDLPSRRTKQRGN